MKTGKNIMELAQKLQDIQDNKRDFIVPVNELKMEVQAQPTAEAKPIDELAKPVLTFTNGEKEAFELNAWSGKQLAGYTNIPTQYYERIERENPALLADNVNHGLRRQAAAAAAEHKTEQRMVRVYGNSVRALVSDRYRRLDCFDLFETVAPILIDNQFEVKTSEVTDRRMYIQAVTARVQADIKVGDTVQYGLVISSSDVGAGSVRVEPLIYRLVCTNGMVTSAAMKRFHLGGRQGNGDDVQELLTDETLALNDAAFWAQVRDVVTGSMKPEYFTKQVDRLRIAANEKIENFDIPRVVELASRTVGVTNENVKNSITAYLANGADGAGLTRWGLANAFTAAANMDEITYDDAIDLERAGAAIIDLKAGQWKHIAAKPE